MELANADPPKSRAINFHDRLASQWEKKYKTPRFAERLTVLAKILIDPQAGKMWLDAGCGTGTIARWLFCERGASVTAIDASVAMLANATASPGVSYLNADIMNICLRDRLFDGIVCSSVLEYLPNPENALTEFYRLLKPGGILLVSVPHSAWSVRFPLRAAYWLTRPLGKFRLYDFLDVSLQSYTPAGISELLHRVGFVSIETVAFGNGKLPFGLDAICPGALLMSRAIKC